MAIDLHVDDIGTLMRFTVKENGVVVDLSDCTELSLTLQRQDKTIVHRPLRLTTNGEDGKVEYVVQAGDIIGKGTYKGQIFLAMTSGSWHTSIVSFTVEANLDATE